jgi:hypothetical protein
MPSASEAVARSGKGRSHIGWLVDPAQRPELLQQFPPRYRNPIAHHVTLAGKVSRDAPLPQESEGEIVGRVDDGRGVEALIVRIDGSTDRPGGGTYHITWSLEPGRRAKESNDALSEQKWEMFDLPMPVRLQPSHFDWSDPKR